MRPETMTGGDIFDNDRLHEILLVWMDCRERGEPVEVGSLMLPDERPELVAEIRRWVACVEEFERVLVSRRGWPRPLKQDWVIQSCGHPVRLGSAICANTLPVASAWSSKPMMRRSGGPWPSSSSNGFGPAKRMFAGSSRKQG